MGRAGGNLGDRGHLWAALTLACLAALALAIPALGSRGASSTSSTAFPPDTQRTTATTCPARTHATGGGFQVVPGGTPGSIPQSFTTNSTFSGRRGWTVTSGSTSQNPPAMLTARVRCERKRDGTVPILLPGSATITPDTTDDPNVPGVQYDAVGRNLIFHCPPGTHPIGGGYSVDRPFDPNAASNKFFATQNRRTGKSTWTISGYLLGGPSASNPPAVFTGKVPCERNGNRRLVERSRVVAYGEDVRSTASVACGKGRHLVSGGFAFTPAGAGAVPVPFVDQAISIGGRTWQVSAYDSGFFAAPPGSAMSVYAYCRRNRPKRRRARRSVVGSTAPSRASGWVEVESTEPIPIPDA